MKKILEARGIQVHAKGAEGIQRKEPQRNIWFRPESLKWYFRTKCDKFSPLVWPAKGKTCWHGFYNRVTVIGLNKHQEKPVYEPL